MEKLKDSASEAIGLVAVLLISRSRPGPKLVFHYPPEPCSLQAGDASRPDETEGEAGVGSEDLAQILTSKTEATISADSPGAHSFARHRNDASEMLWGFTEDSLVKVLCPNCRRDRKRYEMSIDGLTYLGRPAFADNNGSWARKHSHKTYEPPSIPVGLAKPDARHTEPVNLEAESFFPDIEVMSPPTPVKPAGDFTHVPESFDSRLGVSLATSFNSESTTSTVAADPLTMFHLVFVLKSTIAPEVRTAFYSDVVKTLTTALVYCQKQTSYVGTESRKLLAMKTKARHERLSNASMCAQMVENSELAWALREVYEQVSSNGIAGIRLAGHEMSVQMRLRSSPTDREVELNPHCALVLLEDKDLLLRALAHPDASPLACFIREHTPTKSLQKLAARLDTSIEETLFLAAHLINWRKARPEMPLHPRNFYILSPSAPIDRLADYVPEYARRFSALPPLPQILKALGSKPVKYGMLIPSRDHRVPYMEILAYLVRHNFVLRMRTRGWLRAVSSHHALLLGSNTNLNKLPLSVASLLSPQLQPIDDETGSVSSQRTAIPTSTSAATSKTPPDMNGEHSELDEVKLILDPIQASEEEQKHLSVIRRAVQDADFSDRFSSLMQYFNGQSNFEDVAAIEGLKRSKLESWLEQLQRNGLLWTYRSV